MRRRRLLSCVVATALACLGSPAAATPSDGAKGGALPRSTIGVAPFAPGIAKGLERALPDIASLLAGELGRRSAARVVAPSEMRHGSGKQHAAPDLGAADARSWADLNGVDSVVLGHTERRRHGGLSIDVELRSGHSGAADAEYRLEPFGDPDVPSAVRRLATLILADLAQVEGLPSQSSEPPPDLQPELQPESTPVSTPAGELEDNTDSSQSEDDADRLSLMPGTKNDDPISINSEELEVVPLDGGRRLVFSRNVVVLQGDIRLDADRLEAIYPAGASRPDKLVAEGNVEVEQGDRNASCEQATYDRTLQTIVCRGKAEVVQGCDRVRGREIEFDLERERVRVTGAASVLIRPEDDGKCKGEGLQK